MRNTLAIDMKWSMSARFTHVNRITLLIYSKLPNHASWLILLQCINTINSQNKNKKKCLYIHKYALIFFCKKLWVRSQPQSCLYFQGFWGSKLLKISGNPCNDSESIFVIRNFKVFPIMILRRSKFGVLLVYNNYITCITKEKLHFSL